MTAVECLCRKSLLRWRMPLVNLFEQQDCPASPLAALLASGYTTLRSAEFRLRILVDSWVLNLSAGGTAEMPSPVAQLLAAANTARLVNTRIISRRYSGVRADVVRGFAVPAARSPTSSASDSSTIFPARISLAPFTSTGEGVTAVIAKRASTT